MEVKELTPATHGTQVLLSLEECSSKSPWDTSINHHIKPNANQLKIKFKAKTNNVQRH